MKTIKQKLAERMYELLPHKKELVFGCGIIRDSYNIKETLIKKVRINNDIHVHLITDNESYFKVFTIKEYEEILKEWEIIGQPLRPVDILLSIDKVENSMAEISSRGYKNFVIMKFIKDNKLISFDEYNLSKDNILEQSDDFCECVFNLIK